MKKWRLTSTERYPIPYPTCEEVEVVKLKHFLQFEIEIENKMMFKLNAALFIAVQLIFPSFVDAFAVRVETTDRKRRLGKKSFIQRQERGKLQKIASAEELKDLASTFDRRKPGSDGYWKGWKHWCMLAIESIRYDLSENLPYPTDKAKFENLFYRLGVAADMGDMPSFSDPGARSGYALEFFSRARNLADLYIDAFNPSYTFPEFWVETMLETPMLGGNNENGEPYHMVSLGGGPAFDFVGAALASSFSTSTTGEGSRAIKATILDYEEGWGDLVEAMDVSTRNILQELYFSCKWGGKCDITKPLKDPSNVACLEAMDSTELWTCQYCVAENLNLLRESNYIFFRDLFENAKDGAIFIMTETHPRIWPELYKLMKDHCTYMEIGFNKNGRQMLLRKGTDSRQSTPLISKKDRELLEKFENIGRYHERKMNAGWERKEQKIRGS